jgi:capsular polysaccharide biosynthesis protein
MIVEGPMNLLSLRSDPSVTSEVRSLFDPVCVTRQPILGTLMKDRSAANRFSWARYNGTYETEFPDVRLVVLENVSLVDEIAAIHHGRVITDHLIGFTKGPDGKMGLMGSSKERLAVATDRLAAAPAGDPIDDITLICNNEGGGTWGHWVVQTLPKVLLFKKAYPSGRIALPQSYMRPDNNFGLILSLYGIGPESVLPIVRGGITRLRKAAFVDHLYFDHAVHPKALEILGEIQIPSSETMLPPRILFDRSTSAPTRNIENIEEIAKIAKAAGFARGRPAREPVALQATLWRDGTHFLGVLGSDLTNIVFAKPGSHVLAIAPDFHADTFFFDLAAAKGLVWHELLCGRIEVKREPMKSSSFHVEERVFGNFLRSALAYE